MVKDSALVSNGEIYFTGEKSKVGKTVYVESTERQISIYPTYGQKEGLLYQDGIKIKSVQNIYRWFKKVS